MSTNNKYAEQRRQNRVTIAEHPTVIDAHTGEALGQLVNLSAEGLMIAGSNLIDCNLVCQMRIPLAKGEKKFEIRIGAESLWSEDANDTGIYWTGFQIIDIAPEDQRILDAIVGD